MAIVSAAAVAPSPGSRVRDRLQSVIARLEEPGANAEQRIALAEACFRLAVQPGVDIDDSIDLLRKAEQHDPYHPKLPFHLGRLLHQSGDPQAAVLEYRRALRLAPRSHRTYVHLALALQHVTPEQKSLAPELLRGLADGDDNRLRDVTTRLDRFIETQLKRDKDSRPKKEEDAPPPYRDEGGSAVGRCRWNGLWKLSLLQEVARPRVQKKKVGQLLDQGRASIDARRGASEFALACLFLALDNPAGCRAVEGILRESKMAAHHDRLAVRMMAAVCELAHAENAAAFVDMATVKLQLSEIPPELVSCLHYTWYGADPNTDAITAAALVDGYPEATRALHCFKELRVAILDRHARDAWASDRLDRAEILWQATVNLDPFRIAVAHNLALLATRNKSRDTYERCWVRAAELRYLLAAAAGDVRIEMDDRVRLHRSFAQQCQLRYTAASASHRSDKPEIDFDALLADRDALLTWLREWDLYYLNSRLRFHSSVHLLGLSRDCSDEDADAARQNLVLQLERCCSSRRWAGIQVFVHLAESLVTQACAEAKDAIGRKRDPYHEAERTEAEKLAIEAIDQGLLLFGMLKAASDSVSAPMRLAGYHVAQSLLTLPWRSLEAVCKKSGRVASEVDLVDVYVSYFLGMVSRDTAGDAIPADVVAKLSVFSDCLRALPDHGALRLCHCRFLLQAKQSRHAYDAALEALPLIERMPDRAEAATLQQHLINCIDTAALQQVPSDPLNTREALTRMIADGRQTLTDFPRAGALRQIVARCLIQLAEEDPAKLADAATLLEQGLELVLSGEQLQEFRGLLAKAGSRSRAVEAVARIQSLLASASRLAREAVDAVREERSPATLRDARDRVEEAIHEATQAEAAATEAELTAWAQRASQLTANLREMLDGFERG